MLPHAEGEYDPEAEIKSADPRYRPPLRFIPKSVSHKNAGLELASSMESMGLIKEAADTVVEHPGVVPKDDLEPWLKAPNIYRKTGRREEFMSLAEKLHQELNVEPRAWDYDPELAEPRSLLEFERIVSRLQELWPLDDKTECEAFLNNLLIDNRGSMRNGFPQDAAEDIALLLKMLRPPVTASWTVLWASSDDA